jgi:hypothetical protein
MRVICEQITAREIPESMTVSQSDNAWHPTKDRNYVEWWYFDLTNADGSLVRGQFYLMGDISRPKMVKTGIRASLVRPDLTEVLIEKRFPYSEFKASTETCDVELGKSFIRGNLSHCDVHVEDGADGLDLAFDSGMTGFKGRACFGDEMTYMMWVVPQPRGHAKGTFRTKGEMLEIDGLGYRDHNWLNMPPMKCVSYWDWGRAYDKEFTFIFADILATKRFGSARVKPLMVYDSTKLVWLTMEPAIWGITKSDVKFDPHTRLNCPQTTVLRARDSDFSLDIDLRLQKAFQKIDLLADFDPIPRFLIRAFLADPFAVSFLSKGSGKLALSGREHALACTAIHERVNSLRGQRLA